VMGRVRTLLVGGGIKAGKWGIVYRDEGRMRGRVVCCGFGAVGGVGGGVGLVS